MKKVLACIFCLTCISVFASDYKPLSYDNIKDNGKITITDSGRWTAKVRRKDARFTREGSIFYSQEQFKTFDTACEYIFINDGRLIGYSASDLKFYEFKYTDGNITKFELDSSEVASLFKDFRVILLSEFSTTTNVYKFKKHRSSEKILILNDTNNIFENYTFSSNNAKFEKFEINNALEITKKGMIQFSPIDNTKTAPWFIILVR